MFPLWRPSSVLWYAHIFELSFQQICNIFKYDVSGGCTIKICVQQFIGPIFKNFGFKQYWTSGFVTTHLVDFLWVCKTSYHLFIPPHPLTTSPIPSHHPITQHATHLNNKESHWRKINLTARVECGASMHAIFLLMVRRIQMFFSLKPSQSQGESSLKISARWGSPFRRS